MANETLNLCYDTTQIRIFTYMINSDANKFSITKALKIQPYKNDLNEQYRNSADVIQMPFICAERNGFHAIAQIDVAIIQQIFVCNITLYINKRGIGQ